MRDLTRRRFLQFSGVTAAAALAAGGTAVGVDRLLSAPPSGDSVLVLVTLYGGNDGLNTLIPAEDRAYQDGRPELAYAPEQVLALGEGLGLNPGLRRLHGLWEQQRLTVVRGVGYPRPDHSHFRSMAIWQTASPDTSVRTGWLGRWLDHAHTEHGADPLRAVSLEPTLPPFLAGERTAGATIRPEGLALPQKSLADAYRGLGVADGGDSPLQARAAESVTELFTVAQAVNGALTPGTPNTLAAQLGAVAALVRAGAPPRVYSASLGGFDTHADERGTQERLLGELDAALGGFVDALAGVSRRVVTVVYSEFGRRVRANAGQGTDHGTAAPVFVLGERVRSGFLGEQPSLEDLDDGDLKYTVDFRDVYASVLEDVLGADVEPVLGTWKGRAGFETTTP
ncbi:DUF1501 domain-containing protein [Pseudonocardia sp. WMMC193]|uniref:DUF1501 domain-containing protein n=1 Tax=Pseudonocardia sp. WMMC193 TaxID=2911965 RepID=UPI001F16A7D2|nr:DUF1501 domain-containing protein [Pseudonocardia sp. WMMC193]MCF7547847.1 DUF1501 domain-containing protein [Pseudonocardia sp. WMMC193]